MAKRKVGRPSLREGEASAHVGMRLPHSQLARLEAAVDRANARAKKAGVPPSASVSTLLRMWVEERLDVEEGIGEPAHASVVERVPEVQVDAAPRSEPEVEGTNGRHSDETQVREPVHRKRVRPPTPPPVVTGPITEQSEPEAEPEDEGGPPGDEDLEALLRDTPL